MVKLLPKIRASLAIELYKRGFSQKKIAELLEVTQAEVSNYINRKRGNLMCCSSIEKMVEELIKGKKLSEILCNYCDSLIKELKNI